MLMGSGALLQTLILMYFLYNKKIEKELEITTIV